MRQETHSYKSFPAQETYTAYLRIQIYHWWPICAKKKLARYDILWVQHNGFEHCTQTSTQTKTYTGRHTHSHSEDTLIVSQVIETCFAYTHTHTRTRALTHTRTRTHTRHAHAHTHTHTYTLTQPHDADVLAALDKILYTLSHAYTNTQTHNTK